MTRSSVGSASNRQAGPRVRRERTVSLNRFSGFSFSSAVAEIFDGVQWTPSLVAFLYYYFVVITYWLPGADIGMVVALATLIFQLKDIRIGRVLSVFGLWVAWAWLSYVGSTKQALAFDQTWTLTKLWLVAFVAFNVLRTREQLRFFLGFATACFMLFPLRGAFVNHLGGASVGGRAAWNFTYNNPNDLAGFALIFSSIALAYASASRNKLSKVLSYGSAAAMVLLIFFTQSRGALLATALVASVRVVSRLRNPRVVLGTVAAIIVAGFLAPQSVWNRVGGLANVSVEGGMRGVDKEGSAEQRFQLLRVASLIAMDHPVAGVGAGTYQDFHADYARNLTAELPLVGGRKDAHNTYMETAAELGFVGLAIFLVLCGNQVVSGFRAVRKLVGDDAELVRVLTFGLVGFLLAGLFGSLQYINVLHLHLVLLESTVLSFSIRSSAGSRASSRRGVRGSAKL